MYLGDTKDNPRRICTVCQMICDLTSNPFEGSDSSRSVDLEQSFEELRLSALAHCVFCAFRLGILADSDIGRLQQRESVKLSVRLDDHDGSTLQLLFNYDYAGDGRSHRIWERLLAERTRHQVESSVPTELPRSSLSMTIAPAHHNNLSRIDCETSSDQTFARLQRWISECDSRHDNCGKQIGRNPDFVPSRLICVDDRTLRLCRKEILPWRTRYVTLSHCWGGIIPFQLREENIAALENKINQNDLPRTFRDAIEVTRRLGISYIWIDSLCILQDSESDWQSESSLMDQIFENAHLCIAATHARSSTEGLFSARSSIPINCSEVLQIEAKWVTGSPAIWSLWDARVFYKYVVQSRLLGRGWVIQERVLSPRIVHYAQGQIFWECSASRACELLSRPQAGNTHQGDAKPSLASIPHDLVSRYDVWARIVEDYSGAELSYTQKDKAIAIAGVARRLIRAKDYCAGLWRPLMHVHLCWWRGTNIGHCRSGAPTWSWMSLMGNICLPNHWVDSDSYVPLCHITTVEIPLVSDDQFGDMHEGASIHLKANLCRISVGKFEGQDHWARITVGMHTYEVKARLDTPSTEESRDLTCMFVYVAEDEDFVLYALILAPTAQSEKFERRGRITWNTEQEGDISRRRGDWRNLLDFYSRSTGGIDQTLRTANRLEGFDLPLYSITLT